MKIFKSLFIVGLVVFVGIELAGSICADENKIVKEIGIENDRILEINRQGDFVKLQGLIPEETQRGSMSINGLGHFGFGLNVGELLDTENSAFMHVKTPSTSLTGLFESPVTNLFRLIGGDHLVEFFVGDGDDSTFLIRKLGINGTNDAQWITGKGTGEVGIGGGAESPLAQLHVATNFFDAGEKDLFLVSDGFNHETDVPGKEHLIVKTDGNVGISTADPKSKLQVTDGDVYVESIGSGIILRSEDGSCFRVTIKNDGTFASTSLACP